MLHLELLFWPQICTKCFIGWGFAPDPTGGAYSAPQTLLAGFKGPTSKGRGGEKKRREEEGKDGRGKRGRETGGKGKGRKFSFARPLLGCFRRLCPQSLMLCDAYNF